MRDFAKFTGVDGITHYVHPVHGYTYWRNDALCCPCRSVRSTKCFGGNDPCPCEVYFPVKGPVLGGEVAEADVALEKRDSNRLSANNKMVNCLECTRLAHDGSWED